MHNASRPVTCSSDDRSVTVFCQATLAESYVLRTSSNCNVSVAKQRSLIRTYYVLPTIAPSLCCQATDREITVCTQCLIGSMCTGREEGLSATNIIAVCLRFMEFFDELVILSKVRKITGKSIIMFLYYNNYDDVSRQYMSTRFSFVI